MRSSKTQLKKLKQVTNYYYDQHKEAKHNMRSLIVVYLISNLGGYISLSLCFMLRNRELQRINY